jgi:Yip1 domain
MSIAPALLWAAEDQGTLMVLGAVTVIAIFLMGLRFFRNLFEIISAPTASLKYHGENDNFFFSLMLVFIGSMIATILLLYGKEAISTGFKDYSSAVAESLATQNSNQTYHDQVRDWARNRLDSGFETIITSNLMTFCVVIPILWFIVGFFAWLMTKIFGGPATLGNFLGTTAYSSFFFSIGLGLAGAALAGMVASTATQSPPTLDGLAIGGLVLMAYGLIIFIMGMNNAAELSAGQTVGALIFLIIVLGGASYGGYYQGQQMFGAFASEVKSHNPATSGT